MKPGDLVRHNAKYSWATSWGIVVKTGMACSAPWACFDLAGETSSSRTVEILWSTGRVLRHEKEELIELVTKD